MKKIGEATNAAVTAAPKAALASVDPDRIFARLVKGGVPTSAADKMAQFAAMVTEANRTMNLTRITDADAMAEDHFLDSISPVTLGLIKDGDRVIDIGTGAGFPSVPLACILPKSRVTAVESVGKKADFVDKAVDKLCVNVDVFTERAEEMAYYSGQREEYDAAVSRAVANLPMLLELTAAFVKVGGRVIAYKGSGYAAEVAAAENAAMVLGLGGAVIKSPNIAGSGHVLVEYEKLAPTPPDFPRRWSQIKKSPL